jgi:zinc D-Ala-D-Ala dipeptidase
MKTQLLTGLCIVSMAGCATTKLVAPEQSSTNKAAVVHTTANTAAVRIEKNRPADIINLQNSSSLVDIRLAYATAANFTGAVVPGYQANSCYLQQKTADALAKVVVQAQRLGYKLQLLDCYRPHRASGHFIHWVDNTDDQSTKAAYYPNLQKNTLKQGYIAEFSGHSRGSTLDLTLLRKDASGQWTAVDMGGRYDLFDPISHLNSTAITAQQKANRLLLKDLMQQQGFLPYAMEWWHFTLADEAYPAIYFDFTVN